MGQNAPLPITVHFCLKVILLFSTSYLVIKLLYGYFSCLDGREKMTMISLDLVGTLLSRRL